MSPPPKKTTTVNALRIASDRTLVVTSIVFDGETYRQMERDGEMQSSTVLAVHDGWGRCRVLKS